MPVTFNAARKSPIGFLQCFKRGLQKSAVVPTIIICVFSLLICAVAGAAERSAGAILAENNCARCHAIDKIGLSPNRKAPPFRVISHKYKLEYLQEALAEGIVTGHNMMPEFVLTPKQIDDLLAYFQTLK